MSVDSKPILHWTIEVRFPHDLILQARFRFQRSVRWNLQRKTNETDCNLRFKGRLQLYRMTFHQFLSNNCVCIQSIMFCIHHQRNNFVFNGFEITTHSMCVHDIFFTHFIIVSIIFLSLQIMCFTRNVQISFYYNLLIACLYN